MFVFTALHTEVHFRSSFLFLHNPSNRTFSLFRSIPPSIFLESTVGLFAGLSCKIPAEGPTSILVTALTLGHLIVVIQGTPLQLTARQYGEVVLPDASTGQSPGTLARKLSRCKEGMAHFLPSGYKFY